MSNGGGLVDLALFFRTHELSAAATPRGEDARAWAGHRSAVWHGMFRYAVSKVLTVFSAFTFVAAGG